MQFPHRKLSSKQLELILEVYPKCNSDAIRRVKQRRKLAKHGAKLHQEYEPVSKKGSRALVTKLVSSSKLLESFNIPGVGIEGLDTNDLDQVEQTVRSLMQQLISKKRRKPVRLFGCCLYAYICADFLCFLASGGRPPR